jgi:drug/metabolite transporter (DMT)-like permease
MSATWRNSAIFAAAALLAVTAVWGSTFLLVKNAITHTSVMNFLAIRFLLATLVMFALRPGCLKGFNRGGVVRGILLGVALGGAYVAQTFGLIWASATVSGFITGMFVVFTPFVYWIVLRQKPGMKTWVAIALSTAGLALLGLHGWNFGKGELLTLLCAVFVALHVVGLAKWAPRYNSYGLAFIQILTVSVTTMAVAIPQGIEIPDNSEVWVALAITALFATALAFLVQTWAQSKISANFAAVILTMEPVFAGIFGMTVGGEPFTLRLFGGAVCVLAAMLIIQLKMSLGDKKLTTARSRD